MVSAEPGSSGSASGVSYLRLPVSPPGKLLGATAGNYTLRLSSIILEILNEEKQLFLPTDTRNIFIAIAVFKRKCAELAFNRSVPRQIPPEDYKPAVDAFHYSNHHECSKIYPELHGVCLFVIIYLHFFPMK